MKKILSLILLVLGLIWLIAYEYFFGLVDRQKKLIDKIIPVKVVAIQHGPIELLRTFTGTLEANIQVTISSRISGNIKSLHVDLADSVKNGQIIAELDNAEYIQSVIQATANLEIAKANLIEAENLSTIIQRKLQRIEKIKQHGLSSDSQYDIIKTEQLTQQAQVAITKAKLKHAEAMLETSRIKLSYTKIIAKWNNGSKQGFVAKRYVDVGDTVSINTPLLHIVELNPIRAIFFVTEQDYSILQPNKNISIITDAYPSETFHGKIDRIAPIFSNKTHQAKVELLINNPELSLKPGMFVHITIVLKQVENATIIPVSSITIRNEKQGIFLLAKNEKSVVWYEVKTGIHQNELIQLIEPNLVGKVVILGQHLLNNGSNVSINLFFRKKL